MNKYLFYIFFFLILNFETYSKNKEDQLINIVVTPSGYKQDIKKTNSFITIITKKDIENSSATSLIDLLKKESSIGIASTGGDGSIPSYFLRGFPKKYLKVTVDGLNLSDPTATQSETYLQNISLEDIKYIEILKSPQGSVHGGQAGGGVIAITTEDGIYSGKKFKQKFKVGSNNTFYSGTYISSGNDNFKFSSNINLTHSDGISSIKSDSVRSEKDSYNKGSITLKGEYKNVDNAKVRFVFKDTSSKYEYDDSFSVADNFDSTKTNIQSGGVIFEFATNDQTKHIVSYNPTRVNRRVKSSYPSDQSSKQNKIDYKFQKKINDDNFFGVGLEYNNIKYKSSSVREKRESDAKFLYTQISPFDGTLVDFSIRADYDQIYGSHESYRAQIGYNISKNVKLKSSYATGYRPPSLYESNNIASGLSKLEPEITTNKEIGINYINLSSGLTISSSIFDSEIDNEIEYSGGYLQGNGFTEISGFEISGKKLDLFKNTDLFASYTKTDSDKSNGDKGSLVPMHKFTANIDIKTSDKINNQLEYIYQERAYDINSNELPSFSLVNYNFNYKINQNMKSSFKVKNLFNQEYEVNRNYNTPDISFFGGIESEF